MKIARKIAKYDKRVSAGIEWLNQNRPGWLKKIKLEKLDLHKGRVCIIGQAFKANFGDIVGTRIDGGKNEGDILSTAQSIRLGFFEEGSMHDDYDLLTAIWYEKIKCMRS